MNANTLNIGPLKPWRLANCHGLWRPRNLLVLFALLLTWLLLIPLCISVGAEPVPFAQSWQALWNQADPLTNMLVQQLRLPRILLALAAGGALAIAGYLLQNLTRVSLASPALLGVVDGAGIAVLLLLLLGPGLAGFWYSLAAWIGALASFALVYSLSLSRSPSINRLILVGLAVGSGLKAIITLLMLLGPIHQISQAQLWLIGYVNQSNWQELQVLLPLYGTLLLLSLLCTPWLNANQLDQPLAQGIGIPQRACRIVLILLSCGLTASAVAFAGALGFIGLIVPHLIRRLIPSGALSQLLGCALAGGLLTLLADLTGRLLLPPYEIPAGVFTALFGVPLFLFLFTRGVSR